MFWQRVSRYGFALLLTINVFIGFACAYPGFSETRILVRQDSNLTISEDGQCGGTTGQTCVGSEFGDCCSETGWCGKNSTYCGNGCRSDGGIGICPTSATSSDGTCGGPDSITCLGSEFGNCCSARGYCGGNSSYCGAGCQSDFGQCASASVSSDGTCGGPQGISCQGSDYGNCCSMRGYCGANSTYCGAGCQSEFGTCFPAPSNAPSGAAPSATADQNSAAESSPGAVPGTVVKSGLTGGAIAGVVIGAVFGISLAAVGIFFLWRRSNNKDTPDKRAELDTYSGSPSVKEVWQYRADIGTKPEETRTLQELDNPVRYEMPDTNVLKHELSVNKGGG